MPTRAHTSLPSQSTMKRLHVVVPFYRNEALVPRVCKALSSVWDELAALEATVYFYNDSPDYAPLGDALAAAAAAWKSPSLHIVTNEANLGFIGTCNQAFAVAVSESADVILLNSDTLVTPGALREMVAVASLDPMFGFVSPRSNNATLATLPYDIAADAPIDIAYAAFAEMAPRLPRFTLAPTAIGFALWIRGSLLAEFGGFDPLYGRGYNEENDLILRANRYGYRAVLANHAFVWHEGEASFGTTPSDKTSSDAVNGAMLVTRYPEYPALLKRHFESAGYRAERLLAALATPSRQREIGFDFSSFGCFHNGTFESGLRLLKGAINSWPQDVGITVAMDEAAWNFHSMATLPRVKRVPPDSSPRFAAVLRIGQPFHPRDIRRLYTWAPVVGVFMLDTISTDCGYLSVDFDDTIWRFVFEESDVVFTNSSYTLDQIKHRYRIGADVTACVSRHSLDVNDYVKEGEYVSERGDPYILVVGNHYAHKGVGPAVDAIAAALPGQDIVAIGYPASSTERQVNVRTLEAGHIPEREFESLYTNASVIVFPSHYEGFGFPILHGMARRKPVFARDSALNRELRSRLAQGTNLHLYGTTEQLIEMLRSPPTWIDELASVPRHNWTDSAAEVLSALNTAISHSHATSIASRLERLDEMRLGRDEWLETMSAAQRLGLRMGDQAERMARHPLIQPLASTALSLWRRLRSR